MITIYQVGGSIRDELLGLKSKDIDYSVEASSYEEMRDFIASNGKVYLETPQYFTIRAHMPELGDADFVLCRKDGEYQDGRRPETVEVGTIYDDLARRDFTVNALARKVFPEVSTTLLDLYNGERDLKEGWLRCVGNPKDRFNEDALRMLRALRFSITKGLEIAYDVKQTLQDPKLIELLRDKISQDRKKDELHKMFRHSTFETLRILNRYSGISQALFDNSLLWLEPTLKEK